MNYVQDQSTGRKIELINELKIGRSSDCEVFIKHEKISREHALIYQTRGAYFFRDLHSHNGSFINNVKVHPDTDVRLQDKDIIKVGDKTFLFSFQTPVKYTEIEEFQPIHQKTPKLEKDAQSQVDYHSCLNASFWKRLFAQILDFFIIIIINIIFLIPVIILAGKQSYEQSMIEMQPYLYALTAAYYIFLTYWNGQTIGKKLLSLKVISYHDERPSFWNILLRETLGRLILNIFLPISFILYLLNSDNRALHDFIGSTKVIDLKKVD